MAVTNHYLELAKKLKALADRGIGGEQYNAKKALDELMEKYHISEEDLNDNIESKQDFVIMAEHINLFVRVVTSIIGNRITKETSQRRFGKNLWEMEIKITLLVTKMEFLEISAQYNFYKALWKEEVENLDIAFAIKHSLWNKDAKGKDAGELSDEDRRKIMRAYDTQNNLVNRFYKKQLR